MLGAGIDWADEFHLVALGSPGEGVIEVLRLSTGPGAASALVKRIAGLEADPAEVRVVLETRHGPLVEALVEAGTRRCRSTWNWCPAAGARQRTRTTLKTRRTAACSPWTGMPGSGLLILHWAGRW